MADLKVQFCGIEFKNPILAASAEPTLSAANMKQVIQTGAGGLVAKTVTDSEALRRLTKRSKFRYLDEEHRVCRGKVPRLFTFFGRTGLAEETPEEWMKELKEAQASALKSDCVIIGSVAGTTVESWVTLAKMIEDTGIRLVELNFGCPHPSEMKGTPTGMLVGQDKASASEITHRVTEAVKIPVIIKLTPQVADVVEMARAVRSAGASAVTIINRFVGFCVDIETGKPLLHGWAGVGGPWVKPLTLRWVSKIYTSLGLPITGTNGVYDWKDAVEFMMSGASLVQFCSVVMLKGYAYLGRIVKDLEGFLDRKGYGSVREIIGLAARAAMTYEEMESLPKEYASIDPTLCTACRRCFRSCFYNAIEVKGKAVRITEACRGCGLCTCVCPVPGAIHLQSEPLRFSS
ncbi:MAG: tRNA-dihydrouridine synthase [Desulfobacterota bacterium]|nr:tRNA-dihydrouridine synthase [Thermodesulfobacteriota bacterium]